MPCKGSVGAQRLRPSWALLSATPATVSSAQYIGAIRFTSITCRNVSMGYMETLRVGLSNLTAKLSRVMPAAGTQIVTVPHFSDISEHTPLRKLESVTSPVYP